MREIPPSALGTFDPMVDITCVYLPDDAEVICDVTFPRITIGEKELVTDGSSHRELVTDVYCLNRSFATSFFPSKIMLLKERRGFLESGFRSSERSLHACIVYYTSENINPKPFVDEDVFVFIVPIVRGETIRYDGRANIYLSQVQTENMGMYHVFVVAGEDYHFLTTREEEEKQS